MAYQQPLGYASSGKMAAPMDTQSESDASLMALGRLRRERAETLKSVLHAGLAARRHVNRLCLAAKKPLIESGTTGYLGQGSVHLPHKTECFECTEKPTPKTYPICTLVRPSNNAHAGTVRELSLTSH